MVVQPKNGNQKESIAFYFSTELLERMEELHFHIQRQIPREKRKRLSKSKLYELSLECIVKDYEENKCNALLSKTINEWLERIASR